MRAEQLVSKFWTAAYLGADPGIIKYTNPPYANGTYAFTGGLVRWGSPSHGLLLKPFHLPALGSIDAPTGIVVHTTWVVRSTPNQDSDPSFTLMAGSRLLGFWIDDSRVCGISFDTTATTTPSSQYVTSPSWSGPNGVGTIGFGQFCRVETTYTIAPNGQTMVSARVFNDNTAALLNTVPTYTSGVNLDYSQGLALTGFSDSNEISSNYIKSVSIEVETIEKKVAGSVLLDNGTGGGAAHDSTANGAEQGLAGVVVRLTDCGGGEYAKVRTDATGNFSLPLAAAPLGTGCIERAGVAGHIGVSSNAGGTGGTTITPGYDVIRFNTTFNTDYSGVVFGMIAEPDLAADGMSTTAPGGTALVPHRYTATTAGSVVFVLQNETVAPASALAAALYRDADCSGTLEGSEALVTGGLSVTAGDTICLLVRILASAAAPDRAGLEYELAATTTLSKTLATLAPAVDRDVVRVAAGRLDLTKQTRNVTAGSGFAASGTGAPGDILEYRTVFTNPSAMSVEDVSVHDRTPAFTSLSGAPGALVAVEPGGMNCAVATPAGGGTHGCTGDLRWDCAGSMAPGRQGRSPLHGQDR